MTDAERDQVDGNAQAVMRSCGEEIRLFRSDLTRQKLRPQVEEHRSITITMIDTYMKVVCKIFSEMKGKALQCQRNFLNDTTSTLASSVQEIREKKYSKLAENNYPKY